MIVHRGRCIFNNLTSTRENIMNQTTYYRATLAGLLASTLAACGGSSNSTTTADMLPENAASQTVESALLDFPNQVLPRFALSSPAVTAAEIYRRVDYSVNSAGVQSWGVEGVSSDELREIERRFDTSSSTVESAQGDLLVVLPANVQTAFDQRYPGAEISEIVQVTTGTSSSFEILLEDPSVEREANYDSDAIFLFEELVIERSEVPTAVLTAVDALNIALPDSEFERITLANDSVSYAVEFESDAGQSISISLTESGAITQVEHEDSLANLSTSDTVATALANYPQSIEADFGTMYTEVSAAEIFRNVNFSSTPAGEITYGIEGVSADEIIELEALYSPESMFLSDVRGVLVDTLPAPVQAAFDVRYSNVEIDEIAETTDAQGTRYAIVFVDSEDEELEANFDSDGTFLTLEDTLGETEIPEIILTSIGNERVLLPIVEFEAVTDSQQIVTYTVEYENTTGDSISYRLADDGTILSVEHEGALPR